MSGRASIFGAAPGDGAPLDLDGFAPRPRKTPDVEAVRKVSEASQFPSRQGRGATPDAPAEPAPKVLRRRRTGRNVQINIKASQGAIDALYRIADANGWVLGETLERAVAALDAALAEGEGSDRGADRDEAARGGRP